MKYKLVILPEVTRTITSLPPDLKRLVRAALDEIKENPYAGKSLQDDLKGCLSWRVGRYRIVYRVYQKRIEIEVIGLGPRSFIYERMAAFMASQPPQ